MWFLLCLVLLNVVFDLVSVVLFSDSSSGEVSVKVKAQKEVVVKTG